MPSWRALNWLAAVALALGSVGAARAAELYVFRDSLRSDSPEAIAAVRIAAQRWSDDRKAVVLGVLRQLEQDPMGRALLGRAAADGAISLYYTAVPRPALARGNYRQLQLSDDSIYTAGGAFYRRYTLRIIAHELTHAARRNNNGVTGEPPIVDQEWLDLVAPRIAALRELLAGRRLDPVTAAQIPFSKERDAMEQDIRNASGLPSAYAGRDAEEAMAEIVAHMLDAPSGYAPPPDIVAFLRTRLASPGGWLPLKR